MLILKIVGCILLLEVFIALLLFWAKYNIPVRTFKGLTRLEQDVIKEILEKGDVENGESEKSGSKEC